MRSSFARHSESCRPTDVDLSSRRVDHCDNDRSMPVDLLGFVRQAVCDTDWTLDALASHMACDRAHVGRLLQGEKSLSVERLESFPPDVIAKFAELTLEAHGVMAVVPAHGENAIRMLVAGLLGVLVGSKLPARAEHMAKAAGQWDGKERRRA